MPNHAKLRELQEALLLETVALATNKTTFYSSLYGERDVSLSSAHDLRKLPTITKSDFFGAGSGTRTSDELPAHVGITSGTHAILGRTIPLQVHRGRQELAAIEMYRRVLSESAGPPEQLTLKLVSALHGHPFAPLPKGTICLPFETLFHLVHVASLLENGYEFARCRVKVRQIVGPLNQLKTLALSLYEQAPGTLDHLALSTVYASSWFLTDHWRRVLSEIYRCKIISVFGLSEIATSNCSECADCNAFHLPFPVIGEVVGLSTDHDVRDDGAGELVITTLVPFTQMQPMIRYRTGDLVQLGPYCPLASERGFRFLGRRSSSLCEDGRILLGSAELYNVLDGLPDVAVVPHASAEVFGLGPAFGRPKFMIKDLSVAKDAELLVELRYSPIIFAERAEAVCSEISRSIAKIPRERGIGSFSVAVVPVRPGALDPSDCLPH